MGVRDAGWGLIYYITAPIDVKEPQSAKEPAGAVAVAVRRSGLPGPDAFAIPGEEADPLGGVPGLGG
jgi:hypothetical protein